MVFDPFDDDDDPLEDPFADDPLEDPFADDSSDDTQTDDLERAFSEGSSATLLAFVTVAVLVHVGLFAASLGAMLIGFRGQWPVGGVLTIGGLLALVVALVRYRRYRDAK